MPHQGSAGVIDAKQTRVLLVEDEELVSMLTEDMLMEFGYAVTCASTLEEGIKAATEGEYAFGLLDINLNGQRSFPIADILAQRNVPFIFASGYGAQGLESRFSNAGNLQKPFPMEMLRAAVVRQLVPR